MEIMSVSRSSKSSIWLSFCMSIPIAVVGYIAWISFLSASSCATGMQAQAKTHDGSMPQSRQAYYPKMSHSFSTIDKSEIESGAQTYVGAINRSQQAYYLEDGRFSSSIDKLNIRLKTDPDNYRYIIKNSRNNSEKSPKFVSSIAIAIPKMQTYKSYVGLVWIGTYVDSMSGKLQANTLSLLCAAEHPGMTGVPPISAEVLPAKKAPKPSNTPSFSQAISFSFSYAKNGRSIAACPRGFKPIR
jgi:hypothetical protein